MRFEFRFESLKSISVLILFVYWLMIGSSNTITKRIIPENAFEHKKKKPGLSTNRPLNNSALEIKIQCEREIAITNGKQIQT